ncbi:hypothetical protein FIBSPDRAFT_827261 [Athelia psychrophila]|uniref:MutL C-terminal dimerisation domain-containing protein n=1 Tax=Athelia psychrophila TaxID=1759441 RepID=A0A166ITR4_9AGAM|nr:hypothetical protein FIBSPDRAFT_827261 [Fibularhizoctonia sp. CBS 109695]
MSGHLTMEKLPAETRSKLRSTQILTSLPQIISELLQNSLDAGATQVDIGVDCDGWGCWVRDNGQGISKDGMSLLARGSEEGRYGTSKAYNPASLDSVSTFGFRGEALASAADLSCLEISSRTSRSRQSWSLILKGGKNLYNGPAIRWRSEQAGTVVCIRDAFYNLPIRRRSHPNASRTFDLIRQDLECFALVFPHVSFSLENTSDSQQSASRKTQTMKIPKTSSSLTTFRHLYGRALSEHVEEINETMDDMKLEGFISLDGAHSKAYQHLYINRHPVSVCDIHRIIDNKFASSSFAKHAFDETGETSLPRSTARRSPRKAERRPVYVLNLTIPPQLIDNCIEPAKASVQFQNQNAVSSFVASVVQAFLVRHGFASEQPQPARPSSPAQDGSPVPRKKRRVGDDGPGAQELPRLWLAPAVAQPLYINPAEFDGDEADETVTWTDPVTGETFVVDQRTGNSYRVDAPAPRRTLKKQTTVASSGAVGQAGIGDAVGGGEGGMPGWLQSALNANDVYTSTESRIPALKLSSAFAKSQQPRDGPQLHHSCHARSQHTQSERRFRKEDLRDAQVIRQVDRKFIACLVRDGTSAISDDAPGPSRALVLIDQHAADERVRVERFLKELCLGFLYAHGGEENEDSAVGGVRRTELVPPTPVLLTRHEAARLAGSDVFQYVFRCWGFDFEGLCSVESGFGDDAEEAGYVQVFVRSVPAIVGEKLLMGDELRELIKGFLGKLEEDGTTFSLGSTQRENKDDTFFWMRVLRYCPRELVDLVNSKACRGAIMFNDTLTVERCERLVRQLSETALPFQCAHGRPSLVPLASLGGHGARRSRNVVLWDQLA